MGHLGGLSRRRRGRPLNAEVNIINLVDVMLVLLIIFMVTAPILQGGIKVDLPKVTAPPVALSSPLVITVERGGQIAIGETRYNATQFQIRLNVEARTKHPDGVIVQADAAAPYGDVLHVLDLVRKAGLDKANLATEPATP
jgi:biopolymer transport protein ExbD/biopolymer transport protein TolR